MDFYVFLSYLPKFGEHKISSFENMFLIVPTTDLKKLVKKKSGKNGSYSFYFNFEGKNVVEKRDNLTDYSQYLDGWKLIQEALDGARE